MPGVCLNQTHRTETVLEFGLFCKKCTRFVFFFSAELCDGSFSCAISQTQLSGIWHPVAAINSCGVPCFTGPRDPSLDPGANSGAGCADPEGRSLSMPVCRALARPGGSALLFLWQSSKHSFFHSFFLF